jgi:hypothetical protein
MRRLLVTVAIALFACPALARASDLPGTYVVSSCALGDQPIALSGWVKDDPSGRHALNNCGRAAGYFGAGTGGQEFWSNGETYGWLWDAPKDLAIIGVRVWGYASSSDGIIGGLRAGDRWVSLPSGGTFPAEDMTLNTTRLLLGLLCEDTEGCSETDPPPAIPGVQVVRLEILLRDLLPPETVGDPSGSLLQGVPLSGTVSVGTAYRDRGGGMRSLGLLVDGKPQTDKVISSESCRQPSAEAVPCPLAGRLDLELDTATVLDGAHRVELELRDIAGNRSLVGPYPIVVRNHPAPVALTPGRLAMSRPLVRAKYGARSVIDGALTDFAGTPVAAAQIEVASRLRMRGSDFAPMATVVTDAAGRFSVPVEPGPSRVFRFRYALSEASSDLVIPAPVKLATTPKATRNGRSIRFTGRVPGTGATTRVELQAQAGSKWIPFRTVTLRKGRFSARYRFTKTRRTTRYRFRAVIHADANFPYTAGRSPVVKVLVRP